jgi:flagellar motor switch protein FliG
MMLSAKEKAQLLLAALGPESRNVLQHLSPAVANTVLSSVGEAREPDPDTMRSILDEVEFFFRDGADMDSVPGSASGEPDIDLSISDKKPTDVRQEPVSKAGAAESSGLNENRLLDILKVQKPQIAAYVLSRLDTTLGQSVLSQLPDDFRAQVNECQVENIPISEKVLDGVIGILRGGKN